MQNLLRRKRRGRHILLCFQNHRNNHHRQQRGIQTAILYPTASYWNEIEQRWILTIHGWCYEKDTPGFQLKFSQIFTRQDNALLASALRARQQDTQPHNNNHNTHERLLLAQRARPFLYGNRPNQAFSITVDQITKDIPRKSREGGHFYSIVGLKYQEHEIINAVVDHDEQDILHYQCFFQKTNTTNATTTTTFPGVSLFLRPQGFSIILDVDAIKYTPVWDRKQLLSSLFLEEYRFTYNNSNKGLQHLVQRIQQSYGKVAFHYITYAPWQLYPDYQTFLETNGFPIGSYHMNTNHVTLNQRIELFHVSPKYGDKAKWMRKLIKAYPHRQFILIGDSIGNDPEMYGKLYRQYRKRVHSIYILDNHYLLNHHHDSMLSNENDATTTVASEYFTSPERTRRFARAFRKIGPNVVQIFANPEDAVI